MRTDENFFPMPVIKAAHPLMADTQRDTQCERFPIESDDHHPALPNATVMMVDDEPTTLEVLQAFLEDAGYKNFVTTSQSTCALELIAQENPDVVLLDLNMPEITGFDILAEMRAHSKFRYIEVQDHTIEKALELDLYARMLRHPLYEHNFREPHISVQEESIQKIAA